jgi:pyruvate dehydrogenase E2 component (dihydrolipoamide acetyltransferase)
MATRVVMPQVGITTTEGLIGEWYKQEGEYVKKGEPLFSIETDKVTTDVEATADGILRKIIVPAGETAPVTSTVAIIGDPDEDIGPLLGAAEIATITTAGDGEEIKHEKHEEQKWLNQKGKRIKISPLARKIAAAHGISDAELQSIKGSGPDKSIIKRDIEAYLGQRACQGTPADQRVIPPGEVGTTFISKETVPEEQGKIVPLSNMRRIIAQRMLQSHREIPPFYLKMEVEAARLNLWRQELNERLSKKGTDVKITLTDFLVKASSLALRDYPELNVSYSDEGIIYHQDINVGIATAIEAGLVVPVIKNADGKSLYQIAQERVALIRKARQGELSLAEISGGTFTISNLGMYEVEEFIAIINPPEAAILAVGRLRDKLYLAGGTVQVSQCFTMGLTVDHRAVDGATAARFLQLIKERLEDPYGLLL